MLQFNHTNFEGIFKQYYSVLCNISYSVIKDRDAAEDVVQELFTSLWKNREKLKIKEDIKHYLFRAVRNRSLNYIRDYKKSEDLENPQVELKIADTSADQKIENDELINSIQQAIGSLPEKCRAVFMLSRYEKMSYREISNQLEISEKTVENHISKALKILREKLKNHIGSKILTILLLLLLIYRGEI